MAPQVDHRAFLGGSTSRPLLIALFLLDVYFETNVFFLLVEDGAMGVCG